MTLEGKTALITGSSRGIGKGIALALAENGVKIAIHYFQNERAAKETLEQVRKIGSNGFLVQADVMRPEHVSKSEDGVRETGLLRQQRQTRGVHIFSTASRYHFRTVGHSVRFAGESVPRRRSGSASGDERWR